VDEHSRNFAFSAALDGKTCGEPCWPASRDFGCAAPARQLRSVGVLTEVDGGGPVWEEGVSDQRHAPGANRRSVPSALEFSRP